MRITFYDIDTKTEVGDYETPVVPRVGEVVEFADHPGEFVVVPFGVRYHYTAVVRCHVEVKVSRKFKPGWKGEQAECH